MNDNITTDEVLEEYVQARIMRDAGGDSSMAVQVIVTDRTAALESRICLSNEERDLLDSIGHSDDCRYMRISREYNKGRSAAPDDTDCDCVRALVRRLSHPETGLPYPSDLRDYS